MVKVTIHVTQAGRRASEILADVADQLDARFARLDPSHGFFLVEAPGATRAFSEVRAAFDAVSTDWCHYFVVNLPDG